MICNRWSFGVIYPTAAAAVVMPTEVKVYAGVPATINHTT